MGSRLFIVTVLPKSIAQLKLEAWPQRKIAI